MWRVWECSLQSSLPSWLHWHFGRGRLGRVWTLPLAVYEPAACCEKLSFSPGCGEPVSPACQATKWRLSQRRGWWGAGEGLQETPEMHHLFKLQVWREVRTKKERKPPKPSGALSHLGFQMVESCPLPIQQTGCTMGSQLAGWTEAAWAWTRVLGRDHETGFPWPTFIRPF